MTAAPAVPGAALFAAVDIGASSGRVIVGGVGGGKAELHVVHRFPNGVMEHDGALHWDFDALFAEVLIGLAAAADHAAAVGDVIASIGIDTWAVDYGLVDGTGTLANQPFSYRDGRGATQVGRVHGVLGPDRLYETTGLQHLPFNTIFQLAAEQAAGRNLAGLQALLIPDLIAFKLTGNRRTESTNASTTGLYDAVAGDWATEFLAALDLSAELFPPLIEPGETIGTLLPELAGRTGLTAATLVVAVGSHDTASAVAAVPATAPNFAYISSGTWSLVGVELDAPVLSQASRSANFTNERGVDGTTRYLRNVGGLWLLSESMRRWEKEAHDAGSPASASAPLALSLAGLLAAAAAEPAGGRSSMWIPRTSLPPETCPNASAPPSTQRAGRWKPGKSPSYAAFWTASPLPMRPLSTRPPSSQANRWTSSTLWAADPKTSCCANSPPTPRACWLWPGQWRPRRSATCWSRRARRVQRRNLWGSCVRWLPPAAAVSTTSLGTGL